MILIYYPQGYAEPKNRNRIIVIQKSNKNEKHAHNLSFPIELYP